jgi:hypothetical protein
MPSTTVAPPVTGVPRKTTAISWRRRAGGGGGGRRRWSAQRVVGAQEATAKVRVSLLGVCGSDGAARSYGQQRGFGRCTSWGSSRKPEQFTR